MTTTTSLCGLPVSLSGDHPQLAALAAALPTAAAAALLQITLAALDAAAPPPCDLQAGDHLLQAGSFGWLSADRGSGRGILAAPPTLTAPELSELLLPLLGWLAAPHGYRPLQGILVRRGHQALLLHGLSDTDRQALSAAAARRNLQLASGRGLHDAHGRLWAVTAAAPLNVLLTAHVTSSGSGRSSLQTASAGNELILGSAESAVTLFDALLSSAQSSA
jgi:hypothetical protein